MKEKAKTLGFKEDFVLSYIRSVMTSLDLLSTEIECCGEINAGQVTRSLEATSESIKRLKKFLDA